MKNKIKLKNVLGLNKEVIAKLQASQLSKLNGGFQFGQTGQTATGGHNSCHETSCHSLSNCDGC
jgi:hypothetical protein